MKKLVFLAFALLFVAGSVYAQCSLEGDAMIRYGWGQLDGLPFNQPGPDYINVVPGQTVAYYLGLANIGYTPTTCLATDTFCLDMTDTQGWTIVCDPAEGSALIYDNGYAYGQDISISVPCEATVGTVNMVIAHECYINLAGVCDPTCGDCVDPNIRPTTGVPYYNADTLYMTVVVAPPALGVYQDSIYYVEQGQTQAYIPFTIANQDECAPPTLFYYNIVSLGHIGSAINTSGSVTVNGGEQEDVFGILDAGTAEICTLDTLTIIAWSGAAYDTCVQLVHVISPVTVPLFTTPVVTILVLALVLAAAVFMRRRAVSRA